MNETNSWSQLIELVDECVLLAPNTPQNLVDKGLALVKLIEESNVKPTAEESKQIARLIAVYKKLKASHKS